MSRYFQQLLASSGIAVPALPGAASAVPPVAPMLEEITEERILPPPTAVPPTVAPTVARDIPLRRPESDTPKRKEPEPRRAPATAEPGVVEILSSVSPPPPAAPISPSNPEPPAAAPKMAPAASAPAPEKWDSATQKSAQKPSPAAPETPLTRTELIQHVFRWVGQNPNDVVPPALGQRSPATPAPIAEPPSASLPRAAPGPSSRSVSPSLPPPPAPAVPALIRPAPSPTAPSPATPAPQESTIEISIGTLQVHVDAPPAPKPARRPVAPRPPARGLPAAAAPAIDLNRLRRGFYL